MRYCSGLALFLVNLVSETSAKSNYYDRLAAFPRLEWQALFACLAVLTAIHRWLSPRVGTIPGAAAPLLLLGTLMQVGAPTAACVFVVPFMLGGLAMATE